MTPHGHLLNTVPDFTQTRIDIFVDGICEEHYVVDQALEDYDHIMDNFHAQNHLLDRTVQSGRLRAMASGTFLLEPWDFGVLMEKLPPRSTKRTAEILAGIRALFLTGEADVWDGVEILATEYLCGVWYRKE